ncbi:MAG: aminotransferase class V-fold PLP-dependent enzyme [Gemmatimonadetes bacterium]|nr:aminotransferase class V-fold PLP-dependent enzyme [Gemmatimonadota bacterium]
MTDARLPCQRHHFSLPDDFHYLNCAYMGPLPQVAERAGIEGLRAKRFPQAIAPEDFFAPVDGLRERFARLIGEAEANRIATVPSVSYAVSTIARNTRAGWGSNVVIVHEQFPGNVYPWRRLVAEQGGELRVVAPPGEGGRGEGWTDRILEQIDGGTVVVAMGTVHWTDGTRFDIEAVRARTREVGAALVLDGTQTVGAAPIDVAALEPDALIVAGYKWLLGPYSLSLAWFGDRYLDGVPLEETWIARRGSENFAGLVDYVDEYQPGALRFDVGQRSNFALIPALSASLDLVLEWRPERVSAYCAALMDGAFARLRELGVRVEDSRWRSPHLFGLGLPPRGDPGALKAALARHRVGVSFRGASVRVSPNVYNTANDAEALVAAFEEALGG